MTWLWLVGSYWITHRSDTINSIKWVSPPRTLDQDARVPGMISNVSQPMGRWRQMQVLIHYLLGLNISRIPRVHRVNSIMPECDVLYRYLHANYYKQMAEASALVPFHREPASEWWWWYSDSGHCPRAPVPAHFGADSLTHYTRAEQLCAAQRAKIRAPRSSICDFQAGVKSVGKESEMYQRSGPFGSGPPLLNVPTERSALRVADRGTRYDHIPSGHASPSRRLC